MEVWLADLKVDCLLELLCTLRPGLRKLSLVFLESLLCQGNLHTLNP